MPMTPPSARTPRRKHAATRLGAATLNVVVATMRSIAQASSHMTDIIGVIEGNAFRGP